MRRSKKGELPCDLLDLGNARKATRYHLAEAEYQQVARSNVTAGDVSFPNRGMLCVSESGLYTLIMRSRKAEAIAFRTWVTGTVLPAIRKDGGYIMGEEKVVTGEMDEAARSCHWT